MRYSSADDGKIYQTKPAYSKPSIHKPKGWTETTLGYVREAKQWALCILRNRRLMRRPYTWAVHINLNEELPPSKIAPLWNKTTRKLNDRGIVCLWVREPNHLNKVHYHIIVKSEISRAALARAIEESMPARNVVKWRKRIEPIKNEWRLAHYVVKAKVKGRTRSGKDVEDLYRPKRLLFKPKLPFRKVGTVGDFWERSKRRLWQDIQDIERRIGEGLEQPHVKRLATHVYELLGQTVPLDKLERSFGFSADSPSVERWIDQLLADEWAGEDVEVS